MRSKMKPAIVSLMGSLALALVSTPSVATKVQLLTLSQINTVAESVVVGVVTTTSTRADADRKMVWTDYQLTIQETLRGPR
jgi:glycine betaine/choline ABC-type transport system substrate-binding protein